MMLTFRILAAISMGIVLLFAIGIGVASWRVDDPLASLPRSEAPVPIGRRNELRSGRLFQHVTLSDARLGPINLTISLPDPLPGRRLPLVIVLGGAGTGENNIRFVDAAGDNAIIGYDWPLPTAFPKGIRDAMMSPREQGNEMLALWTARAGEPVFNGAFARTGPPEDRFNGPACALNILPRRGSNHDGAISAEPS